MSKKKSATKTEFAENSEEKQVVDTSSSVEEIESPETSGHGLFSRVLGKFKRKHQQKLEEIESEKLSDEETKIINEKIQAQSKRI